MNYKRVIASFIAMTIATTFTAPVFEGSSLENIGVFQSVLAVGPESLGNVTSSGIVYEIFSDKTATVTGYTGSPTEVTIPETLTKSQITYSVTSIGDRAFLGCRSLTSISLPSSLKSIGDNAFSSCTALKSIAIPESVTSIGFGAFTVCSSLRSVKIPEGVTKIEGLTFQRCTVLTSVAIPESVTSIGRYAFYGCSSLTSIAIPENVADIGEYAFSDCSSLRSIKIPEGVTKIEGNTFNECTVLTSVTIPKSVTSIGNYTFYKCSSLTSIAIPENVADIGHYAFADCINLESIVFHSQTAPRIVNTYNTFLRVPGTPNYEGSKRKAKLYILKGAKGYNVEPWTYFDKRTLKELTGIEVTPPTDVEYIVGQSLDLTGLVVKKVYSDGSKEVAKVTKGNVSGFDSSAAADSQTVTVTVDGKTATFSVKIVEKQLTGIELTPPTDVEYVVGQSLDLTGLVVNKVYNDESKEVVDVTSENISGFDSSEAADSQTVTVTVGENTATFTVKIVEKQLTGIELTPPTDVEYVVGQSLDLTGLVVNKVYNDESKEVADVTSENISGFNSSEAADSQTVTVTVGENTATFTVKIVEKQLTGIELTPPTDVEYVVGQSLDLTGLVVNKVYNDESKEVVDVTSENISGFNSSEAVDSQTVTVTVEGKTATFSVKIVEKQLEGIEVTTPPTDVEYVVGQSLDLTGLVINKVYNDESKEEVEVTLDNVSGFSSAMAEIGQTVTVTVDGKTATFKVDIVDKNTYKISGIVTNDENSVSGATAVLKQGEVERGKTTTDENGEYRFIGLKNGVYNLVVTKEEKVVTLLIVIQDADVERNVTLPSENKNSILVVEGTDTPPVVVGGLDAIAENSTDSNVEIKMTVEKKPESEAENATEIKEAANGSNLDFLDMKVIETINGVPNSLSDLGGVLEVVIPYDFTGKLNVKVYRHHETDVNTFEKLGAKPTAPYTDGTYYLDEANGFIYMYTQKFSTYAIGHRTGGSSGGGSSSGGDKVDAYYKIYVEQTGGGIISPDTVSVKESSSQTFTIKADEGYIISDVLVDGTSVGALDEYIFENVEKDHTIKAIFQAELGTDRENPFTDITEEDWFYEEVLEAFESDIMVGTSDTEFGPNIGASRAMIATIVHRLENRPDYEMDNPFYDVLEDEWYTEGISWCAEQGIVEGYGEGVYKPDQIITREELCAILYRYSKYKGLDTKQESQLSNFADEDEIGDWAKDSVSYAVEVKLLEGNDIKQLQPKKSATRAEVVKVILSLMQMIEL